MNICYRNSNQRAFGTGPLNGDMLREAVAVATDVGYRAFDTAQMYKNEAVLGEALAASGIARDELCITTKVHPDNFGEDRFLASVEQSLRDLRLDHADILLLHWPPVGGDVAPSLRLLEQALRRGLARNIGVSNYTIRMLQQAKAIVDAPIVTNQVEFHPLLDQTRLMEGAGEAGVPLSSFCSLARSKVFAHPEFGEIGTGYGKSAAQVVLRWILQKGVSINTSSGKAENIRANFDIMDFTLSHPDLARIDAMTSLNHRVVDSDRIAWAPRWD